MLTRISKGANLVWNDRNDANDLDDTNGANDLAVGQARGACLLKKPLTKISYLGRIVAPQSPHLSEKNNMKTILIILCLLLSVIGGYALVVSNSQSFFPFSPELGQEQRSDQEKEKVGPATATPPEHVLYMFLFKHTANVRGTRGEDRFINDVRIDRDEFVKLARIARDCEQAVRQIDSQAKAIIEESRAQYPGGPMPPGQAPPQPPHQLLTLQDARTNAILLHRDRVRSELRGTSVSAIDTYVRRQIAARVN